MYMNIEYNHILGVQSYNVLPKLYFYVYNINIPTFDENAFLEWIDHIDVDVNMILSFVFTDGHTVEQKWDTRRPPSKWSETRRAWFESQPKRTYSPERRQHMSERMKQIRKERGSNWRKEKS